MEIDEKTYILGYWIASDKENNNWYMMVCKKDGVWQGQHTFRYESGDQDPFMGNDKKSIYNLKMEGDVPENEVIEKINYLFSIIKVKYNDFSDHFLVKGNADKFMEIAKTKDYLHFKTER